MVTNSPPNGHAGRIDVAAGVSEEALLSAIVCRAETLDELANLRPEHFRDPKHGFVYATARKLWADGLRPGIDTIASSIAATGDLQESLGPDWFGWLMSLGGYGASVTPEYHAGKLIEAYDRRRIALQIEQLQHRLTDPSENLVSIAEALRSLGTQAVVDDIRPVAAGELIEKNPRLGEPVIDGIVRVREVLNIIAKSKVGKSWFTYYLIFCVAMGWKWFGKFQCTAGKALLVDNELHREVLASRLKTVAEALQLNTRDYADRIDVLSLRGRLCDIFQLRKFLQVQRGTYAMVCLDALYRMQPQDFNENDNAGMTAIYNALDQYAESTGAAFVVVHHASKGTQAGKDVVDVGSGAGAMSRAADTHLVLRPHEEADCVVLEAAVRSFKPVEPLVLRWSFPLWSPADDLDPADIKQPKTRQQNTQDSKDREATDAIVEALRKHGKGSTGQIRRWAGMGLDRASRIIAQMSRDGRLKYETETIRGNACDVYFLAEHIVNA